MFNNRYRGLANVLAQRRMGMPAGRPQPLFGTPQQPQQASVHPFGPQPDFTGGPAPTQQPGTVTPFTSPAPQTGFTSPGFVNPYGESYAPQGTVTPFGPKPEYTQPVQPPNSGTVTPFGGTPGGFTTPSQPAQKPPSQLFSKPGGFSLPGHLSPT